MRGPSEHEKSGTGVPRSQQGRANLGGVVLLGWVPCEGQALSFGILNFRVDDRPSLELRR
jgi:hypothetical protein